jgi:hypothetical protein
MEVRRADFLLFAGFCTLLILAVSIAGCTGQNTGTTIPVTPSTPVDPAAGATTPALPSPTPAPILTTAAAPPTQTSVPATQFPDPVSLTINSAGKQTKVYTMVPKPGRTFLVLNITIQNNAVGKGFDLSDSSLSLSYAKGGHSPEPSITAQVRGGLENPIIMPTKIEQNDKRTGQIVFGVADGSGKYTLNLIGSDGAVIASSVTINAP